MVVCVGAKYIIINANNMIMNIQIRIFFVFFFGISNKLINFVVELLISTNNLNDLETN